MSRRRQPAHPRSQQGRAESALLQELALDMPDSLDSIQTAQPPTPPAPRYSEALKRTVGGHPRALAVAHRRAFLKAYAMSGMMTKACEVSGASFDSVRRWIDKDQVFAEECARAREQAIERAEEALRERGVEGYRKGVWHCGQLVGVERVYSDLAAIAWLRANNPGKYARMERVEHTGPGGGPIQHVHIDAVRAVLASRQQTQVAGQPMAQLPAPAGEDAVNLPSSTIDSDT